ncbi:MAG: hypothetical protein IT424_03000 [Pirellulales bacterium]|nr:hypothetical protein [Pirellulales bacterium]
MTFMSVGFSTGIGPPGGGTIALPVSPVSTNQYLRRIDAGILGATRRSRRSPAPA